MKLFRTTLITISIVLISLSAGYIQKKPKILIIGDSISVGYTPFVKETLAAKADVLHNPGNAQHTGTGLKKIREWIGDDEWDIIQFNWGLWDLCYRHPDSKVQGNRDKTKGTITFEIDEYKSNLDSLVQIMKQLTNAKLIFVATTYVPGKEAGRYKKDAQRYNRVAKQVMTENNVTVNDIYEESKKIHKKYGKGNNDVHYTPEGYKALAELIKVHLDNEINKLND